MGISIHLHARGSPPEFLERRTGTPDSSIRIPYPGLAANTSPRLIEQHAIFMPTKIVYNFNNINKLTKLGGV